MKDKVVETYFSPNIEIPYPKYDSSAILVHFAFLHREAVAVSCPQTLIPHHLGRRTID